MYVIIDSSNPEILSFACNEEGLTLYFDRLDNAAKVLEQIQSGLIVNAETFEVIKESEV